MGALLPACSLVLDVSEPQCQSDKECTDRGFPGAACVNDVCQTPTGTGSGGGGGGPSTPWGCLGNVQEPQIVPGMKIDAAFRILLTSMDVPPSGMTAYVCQQLDINCTTPTAGPLSADATGNLKVQLPHGFEGYLKIDSPSTVPSLVFIGRPLVKVPKTNTIRLLTSEQFGLLAGVTNQTPDPARGHSLILVTDCNDDLAPSVQVNSPTGDAATKRFYLAGNLPDLMADRTDASGFAGFFNVPPGIITVEARLADDQKFVGQYGYRIKAGTISYLLLGPTPGS